MKKINLARIIWVTSLFLLLIVILLMVMDYKIHYQYLTNHKLYFYECDGSLCVQEVKDNDKLMFSYYDCGYEECPVYVKNIEDSYALLNQGETAILYDYRKGKTISQEYETYQFINQNYIIVTLHNYKGVINLKNEIMLNLEYEELGIQTNDYLTGYNLSYMIAKKNGKYGIISFKDGSVLEDFKYEEAEINNLLEILKEED